MKHARKILTTLKKTFTILPTAIDYKFYCWSKYARIQQNQIRTNETCTKDTDDIERNIYYPTNRHRL